MSLFRAYPILWLIAVTLGGLIFWATVGNNDGPNSSTALRLTNRASVPAANSTDRDNAAEEVRAVATRISNIERVIENQTAINQTHRDRLRTSMEHELAKVTATIQQNAPQESVEKIANIVNDLSARMSNLEDRRLTRADEVGVAAIDASHLHWIASLDSDWVNTQFETLPNNLPMDRGDTINATLFSSDDEHRPVPQLTIPATTTLLEATALTALVGRIPVRGQLQDPWRFKVLIGAKNLAANGHHIPQLAGMLVAGTARGDLSLKCVSGNIDTATFIFSDGTIQTSRKTSDPKSTYTGLGWISDQFGNPCISGELKSNALQYLTQATLVNTTRATAEAIANAQTEISTGSAGSETATSLVGDIDTFVAGYATQESLSTVADWLNDRQLNSFDAIYIPAGHSVAVHIEESISIDQLPGARKVQFLNTANKRFHAHQGWID